MAVPENATPIEQVNSELVGLNLRHLPIPTVPDQTLGIRLETLEKVCRFSGIKHMDISASPIDESPETPLELTVNTPKVLGVKAGFRWTDVKAHLDSGQIIAELEAKGDLNSMEAWEAILDREITQKVKQACRQSLSQTSYKDMMLLVIPVLLAILTIGNRVEEWMAKEPLEWIVQTIATYILAVKLFEIVNLLDGHEYRPSLLPIIGTEVDRYVLFNMLSINLELVKIVETARTD